MGPSPRSKWQQQPVAISNCSSSADVDGEGMGSGICGNIVKTRIDCTILAGSGASPLSKRTALYAQTGYLWNSANAQYSVSGGGGGTTPGKGMNQLGAMVGMRTAF